MDHRAYWNRLCSSPFRRTLAEHLVIAEKDSHVVMPEEASAEVIRGTSDWPDRGNAITYYMTDSDERLASVRAQDGLTPPVLPVTVRLCDL